MYRKLIIKCRETEAVTDKDMFCSSKNANDIGDVFLRHADRIDKYTTYGLCSANLIVKRFELATTLFDEFGVKC